MSRPLSMPDFSALADTSTSLFEKRIHSRRQTSPERRASHIRKKPSLSLAAGLIMNAEISKESATLPSPLKQSRERPILEVNAEQNVDANLFYAYGLRSDYPDSPPYILTFASAAICSKWWDLVEQEFPGSMRSSPQFFVVSSQHMELMRDDPKFYDLRNKWFYTSQDSPTCPPIVIPLQNANGQPAAILQASQALQSPQSLRPSSEEIPTSTVNSLSEALGRLANVVVTNAEQIHALSVAESASLQHMQEINESNSSRIKAIAESQLKLQALVDQNASHYIALSNASFQSHEQTRQSQEQTRESQKQTEKSQEQMRDTLKSSVVQLQTLTNSQTQLANTCENMMRSIERLGTSVSQMKITMSDKTSPPSEFFSTAGSRINPPPRKLNRRIKGVWYEYESPATSIATPRRCVDYVDTAPKSPTMFKNLKS